MTHFVVQTDRLTEGQDQDCKCAPNHNKDHQPWFNIYYQGFEQNVALGKRGTVCQNNPRRDRRRRPADTDHKVQDDRSTVKIGQI